MAKTQKFIIEGLEYETPPMPPLKTMRNYGLPAKEQVWRRFTDYEQFDWNEGWGTRATPEQIKYLEEEIERLYIGCWVIINKEPTYINNYFYFFLQWMYLENEYYPDYRDTGLLYYRFVEICEKAKLCLGHVLIKGRRAGVSSMEASIELLNGLIYRNSRQGIISKTGDDARDIFEFIVIAFQALPPFLKPSIEGTDAPKKILSLKKQAGRITKDKAQASNREGLNNTISWKATALNSYDSGKLLRILVDESAKWSEVDISTYLKIVGKCLTRGAKVVGKMAVVSTVNKGDKGGDRFKVVWDDSDQSKANRLGQTASKLFRMFIPGFMGYDGYIGRWGESIIENPTPEQIEWLKTVEECPDPTIGAKQYLEMQRALLANDPEGLMEEIRQAPFTWQEVFKSNNNFCHFNVAELNDQIDELSIEMASQGLNPNKDENGRRGFFVKMDNGRVRFIDDPNGIWYVIKLLKEEEANKFEIKNGIQYPTNTAFGGAGLDPYAHSDKTVDKGSDGCVIIRERYSSLNPDDTGMPIAMLLGKMKTKKEFHTQVFNGLQYYGVRILGERAPSDWIEFAIENKLASPTDHKKKIGYLVITRRANDSEIYGIAPQDKEAREEHLTLMKESSYSDTKKIRFMRLLKDRLGFDQDDRTDYDTCIADGYSLMTLKESYQTDKLKPTTKNSMIKKVKALVGS